MTRRDWDIARLLGRTGKLTHTSYEERSMKPKYNAGTMVRVYSVESPFYQWECTVILSFEKDHVMYYKVKHELLEGWNLRLTFSEGQLEEAPK